MIFRKSTWIEFLADKVAKLETQLRGSENFQSKYAPCESCKCLVLKSEETRGEPFISRLEAQEQYRRDEGYTVTIPYYCLRCRPNKRVVKARTVFGTAGESIREGDFVGINHKDGHLYRSPSVREIVEERG